MSLRLRLNLVYTILLGGAILLFGALVFGLVSWEVVQQVDTSLSNARDQLIDSLRVSSNGQFDPRSVANFAPTENLLFQVWGKDRTLQISRPSTYQSSLDETGRQAGRLYFNYVEANSMRMRVLSVPLYTERGPV